MSTAVARRRAASRAVQLRRRLHTCDGVDLALDPRRFGQVDACDRIATARQMVILGPNRQPVLTFRCGTHRAAKDDPALVASETNLAGFVREPVLP